MPGGALGLSQGPGDLHHKRKDPLGMHYPGSSIFGDCPHGLIPGHQITDGYLGNAGRNSHFCMEVPCKFNYWCCCAAVSALEEQEQSVLLF